MAGLDEKENLAMVLMAKILDLVKASGANEREAICALRAAEAMIPESGLGLASTMVIET